jgi:hypothetical protein
MHEFTITDQGLQALKKKLINRFIEAGLHVLAFLSVANFLLSGVNERSITLIGLVMLLVLFSIVSSFKKQVKMFAGYRLVVDQDSITREMPGVPDIVIKRSEIREIVKARSGEITIVGNSKLSAIDVPAEVQHIASLEALLNEMKPVTHKTSSQWLAKYQLLLIVPVVGGIFYCMISKNLMVSIFGSFALVALLTIGFVVIQKSKNIERRVKRWSYVALLPIFFVFLGAVQRLMNELSN